jgi:nucleoid DNA-binding protein
VWLAAAKIRLCGANSREECCHEIQGFDGRGSGKSGHQRQDTYEVIRAFLGVVEDRLAAGEKVVLPGLGTFKVVEKAERTYRNPKTGESIIKPMTRW